METHLCERVDLASDIASWARRPAVASPGPSANALTVDVEDYFHVEAFADVIDRESWDSHECRIERNVDRVLGLFADAGVKGTFFTLGWIAERYPQLVRRIVEGGHELASHGLAHHRADHQSSGEFLADVAKAKQMLEDIGGVAVQGYRAASFSINRANVWAYEMLDRAGYRYSSSLYPARYMPEAPQFAFHPLSENRFMEIPVASVQRFGMSLPAGGGGYFRLFPYWLSAQNMRIAIKREKQPCIFYFHPWEIDEGQPRVKAAPLKAKVRHYTNIGKMESRLRQLLADFSWNRLDRIYPVAA